MDIIFLGNFFRREKITTRSIVSYDDVEVSKYIKDNKVSIMKSLPNTINQLNIRFEVVKNKKIDDSDYLDEYNDNRSEKMYQMCLEHTNNNDKFKDTVSYPIEWFYPYDIEISNCCGIDRMYICCANGNLFVNVQSHSESDKNYYIETKRKAFGRKLNEEKWCTIMKSGMLTISILFFNTIVALCIVLPFVNFISGESARALLGGYLVVFLCMFVAPLIGLKDKIVAINTRYKELINMPLKGAISVVELNERKR